MRHYNDLSYLGLNAPNVDHANGIRFGWIGGSAVGEWAVSDITRDGTDLDYEEAQEKLLRDLRACYDGHAWQDLHQVGNVDVMGWTDGIPLVQALQAVVSEFRDDDAWLDRTLTNLMQLTADELADDTELTNAVDGVWEFSETDGTRYRYEKDGYVIFKASDGDLCVEQSPYYARRGLGSPCIPNGCHLESDGDYKAYALGPEWFDEGQELPYDALYEVATDAPVEIEQD